MTNITCPYCEHDCGHPHDHEYFNTGEYEHDCDSCSKIFMFRLEYDPYCDEWKTDCLNDGKHDWKKIDSHPYMKNKRRCSICGKEKTLEFEK